MVCPKCGAENADSDSVCVECGANLVAKRAPTDTQAGGAPAEEEEEDEPEWVDLVTVMRSSDEAELAVVKSLLEAEGIPCLLKGEGVQEIVGFGRVGGENVALGLVEVQVRREDAQAARGLLSAKGHRMHFAEEETPPERR